MQLVRDSGGLLEVTNSFCFAIRCVLNVLRRCKYVDADTYTNTYMPAYIHPYIHTSVHTYIRSQNVMNDREGGLRVEGISGVGFVGCTVTSASPVLPGTE